MGEALVYLGGGLWAGADLIAGAATQEDLDALVATVAALDTEVDTKQASATAATDAELAAHIADQTFIHGFDNVTDLLAKVPTVNQKAALAGTAGSPSASVPYATKTTTDALSTSVALKQDASTAATDAELTAGLATKADSSHAHAQSDVTSLTSDLAAKQATSEKAQPSGYASLDSGGKVPSGQIPALSLVNVQVAASQAAQLALTTQEGDVVVRSDEAKTYMRNAGTSGTMTDFTFLQTPASAVLSVNGQTGVVSLDFADVGAAADDDSRLSDSRSPSGSAGGVLSGTYPNPGFAADMATQAELNAHESDTTSVHGITDTSVLATDSEVATAVSDHSGDTTSVHGIADTTVLATDAEVTAAVSAHESDTSVHGIADTSVLATDSDVALKEDLGEIHGLTVETPDAADDEKVLVYDHDTTSWKLSVAAAGYTDEQAQDAVGGVLTDTSTIDFTYTDATPEITAAVKAASIAGSHIVAALKPSGTAAAGDESLRALGTSASTAAAGNDSRLSDPRAPNGAAGGVLGGTYPNPSFAADMATQAELDAHGSDTTSVHGITDTSVLATDSDVALKETIGEIHELAVELPDAADNGKALVYDHGTTSWVLAADPAAYTDEQAQDAVGTILTDSATVDFTYTDATPAITGIVKAASLDETHLTSGASIPQAKVASLVADLAAAATDSDLAAHAADTTAIHGIADTSVLATATDIAGRQPLDSDLTSIAALTTTSFGRALLELANSAALLSAAGAQASDSDLTAIAALTTDTFGRSLLTLTNAAGLLAAAGAAAASHTHVAADTTDFNTAVRTNRLDQMATPTADVSTGGVQFTGAITPTADGHLARKKYVDDQDAAVTTLAAGFANAKISESLFNAKGDLMAASAADTAAVVVAGANDELPIYDSGQAAGIKKAKVGTANVDATVLAALSDTRGLKGYVCLLTTPMGVRGQGTAALTRAAIKPDATFTATGTTTLIPVHLYAAELDIAGKTTTMKVRLTVSTNGTAPAIDFTAGLSIIGAASGAADTLTWGNFGTHISGSTAVVSAPGANSNTTGVGSAFTKPADGLYFLTLTTSGALAATNPRIGVVMSLWVAHV